MALGEPHSADLKGVPSAGGGGGDPSKPLPSLRVKAIFPPKEPAKPQFSFKFSKALVTLMPKRVNSSRLLPEAWPLQKAKWVQPPKSHCACSPRPPACT